MRNKRAWLPILAVAMALGTGWAVRGRFGHEQGAAWAGAIGALCLLLVAARKDWYDKVFKITMAAAFGWGISGVMSYGMIVGYGRGTDFVNVYYGLLMLFVLGALYGLLGGGLFGLALVDSTATRVKWHALLAEMIALGLLTYGVLINQLEWFMTPPRSEMWAACLGAGIALAWYIARNRHHNAMKVAICAAVGGGFGFAFGNFLQVMGNVSGVDFNFWNVMEYSIGFFGGAGMAYGTLTSTWPVAAEKRSAISNVIPILFVTLFIPFVVWDQSFVADRFDFISDASGSTATVVLFQTLALVGILLVSARIFYLNVSAWAQGRRVVLEFFVLFTGLYIFLSFLITGVAIHPPEQYLYVINFVAILFLITGAENSFAESSYRPEMWLKFAVVAIGFIAILAWIAVNSHEGMPGSQVRFGSR